jgi:hypothetical protein
MTNNPMDVTGMRSVDEARLRRIGLYNVESGMRSMIRCLGASLLILTVLSSAQAAQCVSVAGHINQTAVPQGIVRQAKMKSNLMSVSNVGQVGNTVITCLRIAKGVYCEKPFTDGGNLTIMTSGNRMIESVRNAAGQETLGISYVCNTAIQ